MSHSPIPSIPTRLGAAVHAGRSVRPHVARASDLEQALDRLYAGPGQDNGAPDEAADNADLEHLKDWPAMPHRAGGAWPDRRAVEARASDIHIEPTEDCLKIRLRVDGALQEVDSWPAQSRATVISRIKVMSGLDIAERRLPQDGRLRFAVRGQSIDFRVATAPTVHGESVVLRILDRSSLSLDFAALGFDQALLQTYLKVLQKPHGILLVTGPTGSGKTTTLLCVADDPQYARSQDSHGRRPHRIPARRHQPDPGQAADRAEFRRGAALFPAPRPGRHHGRRDPRH